MNIREPKQVGTNGKKKSLEPLGKEIQQPWGEGGRSESARKKSLIGCTIRKVRRHDSFHN